MRSCADVLGQNQAGPLRLQQAVRLRKAAALAADSLPAGPLLLFAAIARRLNPLQPCLLAFSGRGRSEGIGPSS